MSRTNRNINSDTPRSYTRTDYNPSGSITDQITVFPSDTERYTEVRTSVVTPGYRSLRRKTEGGPDELPMNPFYYNQVMTVPPLGIYWRWDPPGWKREYIGNLSTILAQHSWAEAIPANQLTAFDDFVINTSLKDLKNSKINLGVVFAERKRTANMVLQTAKDLGAALLQVKRGDMKGAARTLGVAYRNVAAKKRTRGRVTPYGQAFRPPKQKNATTVQDRWLELQYGWLPLLSDAYGGIAKLHEFADRPNITTLTTKKTLRWNKTTKVNFEGILANRQDKGFYTRKIVYYFSVSNQAYQDLASMGITNPLYVAWEVVPYSFVVDWFLPIGQFLDTLDATIGLTFLKGCKTSFKKYAIGYNIKGAGVPGGPGSKNYADAWAKRRFVECRRETLGSFPLPHLPSFDRRIRNMRVANGLALILQRFKRR
jgi:hypothetical protein